MIRVDCEYSVKEDIEFILDVERISTLELSDRTGISRTILDGFLVGAKVARNDVYEKLYSYIYGNNYRINKGKEEILREKNYKILFHGSKSGLNNVFINGSRENCDFGSGFYLGETYSQALNFIYELDGSCIYSFGFDGNDLKVKTFGCDLNWMLAICYFRGALKGYESKDAIKKALEEIKDVDLIIAPIADNRMFYVMKQFSDGEINADVALHSLSASNLGMQYIFKTEKALQKLTPIGKYYVSVPERKKCAQSSNERAYEIDTKLKLAKREFRTGLFIDEVLK